MLTSADDVRRCAGLEEMKHIEIWIGTMQPKDADRMCCRERADTWNRCSGRWEGMGSPAQVEGRQRLHVG